MTDLDRLLELFRGGACDPDTIITTLIERVKEAEKVVEDWQLHFGPAAQRRINTLEARLRAAELEIKGQTKLGEKLAKLIEELQARLRAAEEVVEAARDAQRNFLFDGSPLFHALRHYDEAVERVKE